MTDHKERKDAMSRRRRGKIRRFRFFAGLTALAILLVLGLLTAVGYYTAGEKELFVRTDGYLQAGAGPQAEMTAQIWAEKIRAAEEQAAEQEEQAEERLPEVDPSLRLPNTVDFAALWEQNEDVYAWITVPGTLVDYPVLQHPSDDEYYLHHTIDHVEGLPGSIYSETVNAKDFTDMNTILYGHNMKNDTMFGSLHDYENANFFSEHPYVYIHLPERTLLYQIFSAVKFRSVYLPYYLNYEEEGDYTAYVEELKESPGYMNETAEPSFGNRLLTLHTCIGHDENHRYLVVAVLMGAYDKEL
jgi:sortase B